MTQRVIDLLEAIEVEQRDADLAIFVGEKALEPLLHGVAVGKPSELVEVCELAQLLFGPFARGDVLVHECDPTHPAVLGEYRRGGEANLDPGPVLADAGGLDRWNDLARAGACMEPRRFIDELGGNDRDLVADHLRLGVAVHVLGGAISHDQPAIEVRADDRDRRCVDDGVERVVGAA